MIVVSDTSAISNLLIIGRIDLLRQLYRRVVIPETVADELRVIATHRTALGELDWIETVELRDKALYTLLIETLDKGEAEAIGLSVELSADLLLIDERDGRAAASNLGIDIIGIAGVLVEAKRVGLLQLVKPELEKLATDAGFWISPGLVAEVLSSVGEQ